jgi:hypothetical protein
VHSSRIPEGIETLEAATREFPDHIDSWEALFECLDGAGRQGELLDRWSQAPAAVRSERRLARIEGAVAWARGDLARAADGYRRAWTDRSDDLAAAYRLARTLHALGKHDEAAAVDRFNQAAGEARAEVAKLYREVDSLADLETRADAGLFRRLADNRERLGRLDEARAWHRLVLERLPHDRQSIEALQRIESRITTRGAAAG